MVDPIPRLNRALEGRYRIERELGRGATATVYLAEDLRHERKVALKVLNPELTALVGAGRFLAEIKTTASLQHPNILPLFDSGDADGFLFYVMPYVEGESLRERLDREGRLPVDEAARIASDVAEGIDHAHRQGVVHRDIKPGNILIRDRRPLIADFGIALALSTTVGDRVTQSGLSLGTPLYMSPEQATDDRPVGPQSDTYSLGCVLYEMLVGRPPNVARTSEAVLARIVQGDPEPVSTQRRSVPPNVDAAIRKALEKVPGDRFATAQSFASALGDPGFRYGDDPATRAGDPGVWKGAAVLLALALMLAVGWPLIRSEAPGQPARFPSPFKLGQSPSDIGFMAFTSDGSALVYAGPGPGAVGSQLWLRNWAELDATRIPGTEGALTGVLSPAETEVAFTPAQGPLRVVPLAGGPGRTLVSQTLGVSAWASDGSIYFTMGVPPYVLARVPALVEGDEAVETLTELLPGEAAHGFPTLLPSERIAVFLVRRSLAAEDQEVWALDLETLERKFLVDGTSPRYASTGHLLFVTPEGLLMAAPIDPVTADLTGPAVTVADGLAVTLGLAFYDVSDTGALIYAGTGGSVAGRLWEPVWVSRSGVATPVDPDWRFDVTQTTGMAISPDGTRLAVTQSANGNEDIWIKELPDGPLEQLTFDDLSDTSPFWRSNGDSVAYTRGDLSTFMDIWQRSADGSGSPKPLVDGGVYHLFQGRSSPDGEWMVFSGGTPTGPPPGEIDIVGFRPGRDEAPIPLVATAGVTEQSPSVSPNGRWLAYTSDQSGENEVYVTRFPDVGAQTVRVSRDGGIRPLWAHSGRELFFVDADLSLVAAEVQADSTFRVLGTETLFSIEANYFVSQLMDFYEVGPRDGQFILLRVPIAGGESSGNTRFVLVTDWFTELCERTGDC